MNVAGLKMFLPSTPYDMKGLLKTALRDNNPVISFESGRLMGRKGPVPEDDYTIPFGKADVKREGSDVTVVALAWLVHEALAAAEELAEEGISVEIVDPRSLVPLDSGDDPQFGAEDRPARHRRRSRPDRRLFGRNRRPCHRGRRNLRRLKAPVEAGLRLAGADPLQPGPRKPRYSPTATGSSPASARCCRHDRPARRRPRRPSGPHRSSSLTASPGSGPRRPPARSSSTRRMAGFTRPTWRRSSAPPRRSSTTPASAATAPGSRASITSRNSASRAPRSATLRRGSATAPTCWRAASSPMRTGSPRRWGSKPGQACDAAAAVLQQAAQSHRALPEALEAAFPADPQPPPVWALDSASLVVPEHSDAIVDYRLTWRAARRPAGDRAQIRRARRAL